MRRTGPRCGTAEATTEGYSELPLRRHKRCGALRGLGAPRRVLTMAPAATSAPAAPDHVDRR
eukprot:1177362-Prorocentrum_minimum.AAC.2